MKIFVYGSLKRGECSHRLMGASVFLGKAQTKPLYSLHVINWFPGLCDTPTNPMIVQGEVYEVDDDVLAELDEYEGINHGLFARKTVELEEFEDVQAYFFNQFEGREFRMIPEGIRHESD